MCVYKYFACSGGESSDSSQPIEKSPETVTQTYTITAIDGYLRSAVVWLDLNNNGRQDTDEPSTITQANGKGVLTLSSEINPEDYSVILFAEEGKTFDESLNKVINENFILASPKGEQVISPLTTLVYLKNRKTLDINSATSQISQLLNVAPQSLLEDFIIKGHAQNESVAADLVRLAIIPGSETKLLSDINNSESVFNELNEYLGLRENADSQIYIIRDSTGKLSGDTDLDGIADSEDSDIDGDGVLNTQDAFPYNISEWNDLDNDGIGDNSDPDIDGDNVANASDVFPFDATEWDDLDGDGIGNNSDPDIDGDGILNDEDENPYIAEYNTIKNPGELAIEQTIVGDISQGQWQYFTVEAPENRILNITLFNLSGDIDLYVEEDDFPTKFEYQCRSNLGTTQNESCAIRVHQSATYHIGILAKEGATFNLLATTENVIYKKAMLLLHGLASSPSTWNAMVNDDSFFNGQCQILTTNDNILPVVEANSDGISCFNLEFGAFDREGIYARTGLDNKSCINALGCDGDFTSFEGLGYEVEKAVEKIVDSLGEDTEIFLFGHSRGGLAARSYLQNDQAMYRSFVKGFATTGTPHQGSPLGRFYQYMNDNCIPEGTYRQDGGKCEDNWEVVEMLNGTRTYFGLNLGPDYQMDLQSPSIDLLSPESSAIQDLNSNLMSLDDLVIGQLAYQGTDFGILSKDAGISGYDLYAYRALFSGDHPHPETLRYIENGQTRASFIGDGIVPVYSQKLSLLLERQGISITKEDTQTDANILHTEETERVTDIFRLLDALYTDLEWK
ncbi:thrombospondin type 3 repeat-containing protein [Pseudoalteromonas sp. TAE79]|uniref:thrombospondin type 3 repeat-containing protein n=1 Tax=Pseudoalteromonas sp. TAE79 TaxID=1938597 RepID=UPI000410F998|nr:thrombospondin type 3 repeat-containing protein [Pseudoalteromonas sp. TAE79]